jgi:hypothetical protein
LISFLLTQLRNDGVDSAFHAIQHRPCALCPWQEGAPVLQAQHRGHRHKQKHDEHHDEDALEALERALAVSRVVSNGLVCHGETSLTVNQNQGRQIHTRL